MPDGGTVAAAVGNKRLGIAHIGSCFIVGFLVVAGCRSLGLIPSIAIMPISQIATLLTVVSMAALGLGVDVRTVAKAGGRVTGAVILSLIGFGGISFGLLVRLRINRD
ncbi:putative sulfate exporter family transporter [Sphingomonas sp. PB2P19]|uniref:putative sulfate exporter family transporter n=1 Tax=Sphingomonas rhamnosi TaxID=3096156 RepID=UPI002FCBC83F